MITKKQTPKDNFDLPKTKPVQRNFTPNEVEVIHKKVLAVKTKITEKGIKHFMTLGGMPIVDSIVKRWLQEQHEHVVMRSIDNDEKKKFVKPVVTGEPPSKGKTQDKSDVGTGQPDKKIFGMNKTVFTVVILLLLAGAGYFWYKSRN